jgi:valyl-tRNA synthetase
MIEKSYNPKDHEREIYKLWEESGNFAPKIDPDKRPFVIAMPPPNVTGKLHIGHALFITLQDILTRYHRMQGEPTLWIPGTDHAGIATQTVVDKALQKKGTSRRQLGRDEFVKEVWKWKEEYGNEITRQLRSAGASCDWSRERFTLDEGLSKAVNEAFVSFYKKGLIYRGEYIVNWCPKCATAIADDEVEHKPQVSTLYYFKYDKNFPIAIATTRPETKFGDTAVAVNPSDKRYAEYVGQEFEIDLDGVKRKIKVIADRVVDKAFGTGAVGVTPAHSMADWKLSEDHDLEKIKVINEFGKMNENAGKYADLKGLDAREKLVEYLKANDLLEKEKEFENNLSTCYRCHGAIEPLPSLQWFVKMKPLADKAKKAVKDGEIKIVPKRFEKVYFHWMDNIHDWCISRQLWWGHRIPVWYRAQELGIRNQESGNLKTWDLKIYGQRIFDEIKSGKKSIETRAGKPEGAEKYWGDIKPGDIVTFSLADEKTDQLVQPLQKISKLVNSVGHFDSIDQMLETKNISDVTSSSEQDYRSWWNNFPEMSERIAKYGIWAIELSDPQYSILNTQYSSDIYVGTTPPRDPENWTQDEDVLDTWFSSGLWPFSTLGWPDAGRRSKEEGIRNEISDFDYFYPTTVMETGYDILFFWVARMVMMGLELTGKAPFETVYLHGLVRDEKNRKMSKSLGNVLNPLDVSEKFGTDAMRMALVVGTTAGQDIAVGESKVQGYRNFGNKIWNISRFVMMNLESENVKVQKLNENAEYTQEDKKDLAEFEKLKDTVTKALDKLEFSRAGEHLYGYAWHEFADKIIEQSKDRLQKDGEDKIAAIAKLLKINIELLKMLHPFMPFVTESIWQQLPDQVKDNEMLMVSSWPGANKELRIRIHYS